MYSYQQNYEPYGQYIPERTNELGFGHKQLSTSSSSTVTRQCQLINQRSAIISTKELTKILDQLFEEINKIHGEKKQLSKFQDIIAVLIRVRRPILASVVQHRFLTLVPIRFNEIFSEWTRNSSLEDQKIRLLRHLVRLLNRLFSEIDEIEQYPTWFTDHSFLNTISIYLTDLSKSDGSSQNSNQRLTKVFVRLFSLYNDYQYILQFERNINQDKLVTLIDPIGHCLTSDVYFNSFSRIQQGAKLKSKNEKFLLVHCPTFLTNYYGTRRESMMTDLLTKMLPKYVTILNQLKPSIQQWKRPVIRAVNYLFKIVNHGSINSNVIAGHIPIIDHVLTVINTPLFYNNPQETISNPETHLIHTVVSLLANYINQPTVLAHIKQQHVTSSLLRFTSAEYQPIVYNIYTVLAHTISEDDIKSMQNPGILLSTAVNRLQGEIEKKSDNQDQVIQLLQVLKGLAQHDQLKEEIFKQNVHSFLLQCTNKLPQESLPLFFETLWTLSFNTELATSLRQNTELLRKVQTISQGTNDEALKKATDGLIWKLVQEPKFLDKMAKQAADETETKVIIDADGKEKVITTQKRGVTDQAERVFQYDMMISYCHADKDLIKKIHQFLLGEGFKVWIDLDHMFGPAMNAMAEAVENSEFVLICMSDSYKQSTYCQAEAEYAFGCKRRLVPLIVRPGYRADGWLGFMIGARIYVDFGFFDFETACEKLITEIVRQRKRPLPSKVAVASKPTQEVIATPIAVATAPKEDEDIPLFSQKLPLRYNKREATLKFDQQYVEHWSESDVQDFLYTHQLNELMPLCEKMNGQALIQLHNICLAQYHQTYSILSEQLKVSYKIILTIATYAKFLSVMKKVINPPTKQLPVVVQQQMLPPPPQRLMLPPPPIVSKPVDSSYDIVVTSNAPVMQMLKSVERQGAGWRVNTLTW